MGEKAWARAAAGAVAAAAAVAGATIVASGPAAGAAVPQARATLVDAGGVVVGEVVFKGHGSHITQVQVDLAAPGIYDGTGAQAPGAFHGIHVHTIGACDPTPTGTPPAPFNSAGGHWNPTGASHGRHGGDLPSVLLTVGGEAHATVESARIELADLLDADGAAVVLHRGADNFANIPASPYGGPVGGTLNTGDAGGRYACGVVTPV